MAEATPELKDYALTNIARTNTFLGTSFEDDDEKMIALINAVTEFVERFTGRHFQLTEYEELITVGFGEDAIFLGNYPVVIDEEHDLTLEERESRSNEDDWDEIDAEDFYIDQKMGALKPIYGSFFNAGTQNYRATYSAGYNFDASDSEGPFLSDTEAGDVELAVWKIIGAILNREKSSGVESERIGDYSVTFRSVLDENSDIKKILDAYRNLGFGSPSSPTPF